MSTKSKNLLLPPLGGACWTEKQSASRILDHYEKKAFTENRWAWFVLVKNPEQGVGR